MMPAPPNVTIDAKTGLETPKSLKATACWYALFGKTEEATRLYNIALERESIWNRIREFLGLPNHKFFRKNEN